MRARFNLTAKATLAGCSALMAPLNEENRHVNAELAHLADQHVPAKTLEERERFASGR